MFMVIATNDYNETTRVVVPTEAFADELADFLMVNGFKAGICETQNPQRNEDEFQRSQILLKMFAHVPQRPEENG